MGTLDDLWRELEAIGFSREPYTEASHDAFKTIDEIRDRLASPTEDPVGFDPAATQRLMKERILRRSLSGTGLSSPIDEMRKVYGERTPAILAERATRFQEEAPDIPSYASQYMPPLATSRENVQKLATEIPFGVLRPGLKLQGGLAVMTADKPASGDEADPESGWPGNPVILYSEEGYEPSTIAHEQQHVMRDLTKEKVFRAGSIPSSRIEEAQSRGDEYMKEYRSGINLGANIEHSMAYLAGAVRLYGLVHGRPPETEDEVMDAVDLNEKQDLERERMSEGHIRGLHDALRSFDWVKKVGQYITKRDKPTEGGMQYV